MSAPMIAIKRFWTEYAPDPQDPAKMIGVDWVEYGPAGSLDRTSTRAKIISLSALQPMHDQGNPAIVMAHMKWDVIRPAYEAWKKGQEAPVSGTPLAAWNGVSPEQAEILRSRSIRSVEEVAALTDAHIERIALPNLRSIIAAAKRFVESADTMRFAASLGEKERLISDQQNQISDQKAILESQQAQIADMMAKMNELTTMVADRAVEEQNLPGEGAGGVEPRRGPGRPKKQPVAA